MIQVNNFTKIYKLNKKQMAEQRTKSNISKAVDNISFNAEKGQIFGLLGPNGAGKTTTLRSIATLIKPTEGTILVDGYNVAKDSMEVRRKIGFLTNELKMDSHFTPKYLMSFFGSLYGLSKEKIDNRIDELFSLFGIYPFANKKVGDLSTGMKQKLSIAVSLIHDPQVIVFDEPTNGLDIITAKAVTDYLKTLKEQGKLVVVSTHIMTVASKLCDKIGIIINGKIVAEGTIDTVLKNTNTFDLEDAFFQLYKNNIKEGI